MNIKLTTKDPVKAAAEVLKHVQVVKAPVPVERIAKELGAKLQFAPFDGDDDISAMLYRDDTRTVIGVNSTHAPTRQRFSIAHECGHLVLHKGKMYVDARVNFRNASSSLAIDPEEIQANAFAAELLMPRELVFEEIRKLLLRNSDYDADTVTSELARLFEVSKQAMGIRLQTLGLDILE